MKRGAFLIDTVVSATFILLLLLISYHTLLIYKASEFNKSVEWSVWKGLMLSNNDIARGLSNEGSVCIVRYLGKKEVFCYENA